VHGGPKVDDRPETFDGDEDLAAHYEAIRTVAVQEGMARAGLAAALLVSQGMPAWMRGWRACTPPSSPVRTPAPANTSSELVGVLAQMALACV
jgi:hypothetical protein